MLNKGVLFVALAAVGEVPGRILLVPAGTNPTKDGRGPYTLKDAQAVIEASMADPVEMVIDYDHQTDLGLMARKGVTAPAAGWIKGLEADEDGIWGLVSWTDAGDRAVASQEYRYISPVFLHDKDGNVQKILRASLTNTPNLVYKALNHANPEDETVDLKKFFANLLTALSLPKDADTELALQAIQQMTEKAKEAELLSKSVTTLASLVKLKDDSTAAEVVKAVQAQLSVKPDKPDEGGGEKDATILALQSQVNKLEAERNREKAEEAVEKAMQAGKIAPASKDWAIAYASKNPEDFASFVESQPQIINPSDQRSGRTAPQSGGEGLTEAEKAICAMTGQSEADFLKAKKEETEQ